MSFPRAKRFKDGVADSPAPGTYDPKFNTVPGGGAFERSERFAEKKPEDAATTSDAQFRTPLTPNRLKRTRTNLRSNAIAFGSVDNLRVQDEAAHFKEFIQKLTTANTEYVATISELKDQVDELTAEKSSLKEALEAKEIQMTDLDTEVLNLKQSINSKNKIHNDELESIKGKKEHLDRRLAKKMKIIEDMTAIRALDVAGSVKTAEEACAKERQHRIELEEAKALQSKLELILKKRKAKIIQLKEALAESQSTADDFVQMNAANVASYKEKFEKMKSNIAKESKRLEEEKIRQDIDSANMGGLLVQNMKAEFEVELKKISDNYDQLRLDLNIEHKDIISVAMKVTADTLDKVEATFDREVEELAAANAKMAKIFEKEKDNLKKMDEGRVMELKVALKDWYERLLKDLQSNYAKIVRTFEEENNADREARVGHKKELEELLAKHAAQVESLKQDKLLLKETADEYLVKVVNELHDDLQGKLDEKQEKIQMLEDNLMNSSVVRDNLEVSLRTEIKAIKKQALDDAETAKRQLTEEVKTIGRSREDLRVSNMNYRLTIVDLQDKLDTLQTEFNAASVCFDNKLKAEQEKHSTCEITFRRLQIVNKNTFSSLEALKEHSLKNTQEYQNLLAASLNKNIGLNELIHAMERKFEETVNKNMNDIQSMKTGLVHKVNSLKKLAEAEIALRLEITGNVIAQVEEVTRESESVHKELVELKKIQATLQQSFGEKTTELEETKFNLLQVTDSLQSVTSELETNKIKFQTMQKQIDGARCVYISEVKASEIYLELSREHAELKDNMEHRVNQLNKRILEQDSLIIERKAKFREAWASINQARAEVERLTAGDFERLYKETASLVGPFREQLEAYERERVSSQLEVQQLSVKYTDILGHQNHKQKIKHVVQLKENNFELKQEVEKYQNEARAKDKIIKKLKEDLAAAGKVRPLAVPLAHGKENADRSPARGQSPHASAAQGKATLRQSNPSKKN